jgi:hypothetical protein
MSTTNPSSSIAAPITVSDRSTPDLPTAGLPCSMAIASFQRGTDLRSPASGSLA